MSGEGRWAAPIYLALSYLLLVMSIIAALVLAPSDRMPLLLALSGLCAAWLPLFLPAYRRRREKPYLAVGFYIGLTIGGAMLVSLSGAYTIFASIGYPLAIALFPAGWSVFAVATTAIVVLVAQDDTLLRASAFDSVPPYLVVLAVAGPLLAAGWYIGRQSEQYKKMNGKLADSNARLEAALRENQTLQARLVWQARQTGALDERHRLAAEIHDTLAQGLAGIITQLDAAARSPQAVPDVLARIDTARALARENLAEARRSVRALAPASLDESGLPEAITQMAERWAADAQIELRIATEGSPGPLPPATEIALYRAAQEALANVGKHAAASAVDLTLSYSREQVLLLVHDDGRGFDTGRALAGRRDSANGYGLGGIRSRVQRVDGTLEIDSTMTGGTTVVVTVPTDPGAAP